MSGELRNYQRQGVDFLIRSEAALLADEMGLGKTVQAAVALSAVTRTGKTRRSLVVVPAPLRLNWEQEIRRWAPGLSVRVVRGDADERLAHYRLPFKVVIASYEQIRADAVTLSKEIDFDNVILDEAQRIKNPDSATAFACRILPRERSWALTGTPLENSVRDLISVFGFVRSGLLSAGMTRPEIHALMSPYYLRRRKRHVLPELPPIIVQDIPIELTGQQRQRYDDLWRGRKELVGTGRRTSTANMLALITRLKQLCNFDDESQESAKMDALGLVVDGLSDDADKVIVFSQFVETLQWVAARLGTRI